MLSASLLALRAELIDVKYVEKMQGLQRGASWGVVLKHFFSGDFNFSAFCRVLYVFFVFFLIGLFVAFLVICLVFFGPY